MEKIYSLKELAQMRTETCNAIGEIIKKETKNGFRSARELAEATNGLCSSRHIGAAVASPSCRIKGYSPYGSAKVKLDYRNRRDEKIHHMIEVDDEGIVIRRFDMKQTITVREYKAI